MLPLAFAVTWGGYGITSWGYCLLKGWDVPFGRWFDPLDPWEWTAGEKPPVIPPTQVLPTSAAKAVTAQAQAA
jgi:hypothetical protein